MIKDFLCGQYHIIIQSGPNQNHALFAGSRPSYADAEG